MIQDVSLDELAAGENGARVVFTATTDSETHGVFDVQYLAAPPGAISDEHVDGEPSLHEPLFVMRTEQRVLAVLEYDSVVEAFLDAVIEHGGYECITHYEPAREPQRNVGATSQEYINLQPSDVEALAEIQEVLAAES